MSVFKIKLEDKAAFLNRLDKAGVALDTDQVVDNKLEGYFEVTVDDPKQLEAVQTILKQSPKINTIQEMETKKKLTKSGLKEMVRQELQATLAEMKDKEEKKVTVTLNEYVGDTGLFELGQWAAKTFPDLFKAFAESSTVSNESGQQFVDFGTMIVSLATVGTVAVSVSLAVMKDKLVAAAKKVKNAAKSLFSGVKAEGEGEVDPRLEKALKDLPKDTLAKLAK